MQLPDPKFDFHRPKIEFYFPEVDFEGPTYHRVPEITDTHKLTLSGPKLTPGAQNRLPTANKRFPCVGLKIDSKNA